MLHSSTTSGECGAANAADIELNILLIDPESTSVDTPAFCVLLLITL